MEAINNHTDFPVLSPRTAKPSQGPRHLLVSTQLASEDTSPIGPKAASSWILEMSPTCSQTQQATPTHFSICPLQLQQQQAAKTDLCFIDYFPGWLFKPECYPASSPHQI